MIKSVLSSAYDFGEQAAHVIGVTDRGLDSTHLRKSASSTATLFEDVELKPEKGESVIHIVAMGAAPFYPSNKNGDVFYDVNRVIEFPMGGAQMLTGGLTKTHKTFETNANVFKEHNNDKKVDKIYGKVLKSRYNDDLHRVELLLSLPNDEWSEELGNMERGGDVGFSMSGSLPYDQCTVCGQKSKKVSDYCDHLKYELNQITADGHLIAALNDNMKFFDISGVKNPADRIAFGLLKAASTGVTGGAQLAEMLNIPAPELPETYKSAAMLKKLAYAEGEVESTLAANNHLNSAAFVPDIPVDTMAKIASCGLNSEEILGGLSDLKITLSLKDFLKVLLRDQFSEIEGKLPETEDRLPGVFSRMCTAPKIQHGAVNLKSSPLPFSLGPVIKALVESNGFGDDPKRKRVTATVIKGGSPFQVKSASVNSHDDTEETLAQLYGMYKVALCQKFNGDNDLTFTSALGHYIKS